MHLVTQLNNMSWIPKFSLNYINDFVSWSSSVIYNIGRCYIELVMLNFKQ